jgi:hypothetical protein
MGQFPLQAEPLITWEARPAHWVNATASFSNLAFENAICLRSSRATKINRDACCQASPHHGRQTWWERERTAPLARVRVWLRAPNCEPITYSGEESTGRLRGAPPIGAACVFAATFNASDPLQLCDFRSRIATCLRSSRAIYPGDSRSGLLAACGGKYKVTCAEWDA